MAIEADGSLLIADGGNQRVRRLTPDGSIVTIAGNGTEGFSGDGGDARLAQFSTLDFIAVDSQGDIYVADYGNHAIRVLRRGNVEESGDTAVEWLLLRMRDAYAAIGHVRITTLERISRPHARITHGSVEFEDASSVRARFKIPEYGDVLVDSDGFRITVTDPARSSATVRRHDADNLNRALLGNLEVYSFYDAPRQLSTADRGFMRGSTLQILPDRPWKGRAWTVLEESAGNVKIHYYIDSKSYLIWRTLRRNRDTDEVEYESLLTNIEF